MVRVAGGLLLVVIEVDWASIFGPRDGDDGDGDGDGDCDGNGIDGIDGVDD